MNRQSTILETAQARGRVMVDELAEVLCVSSHTVRRDINALCAQGKLRRLHGGAEFIEGSSNLPYAARSSLNVAAKQQIAGRVAQLIPNGATLFFSIGTTPAVVAAALAEREGLTVITNNLNAAMALSEAPGARIIMPGGELRLPDRDILGSQAVDLFKAYRADFAIYGAAGIDNDGMLLDFHAPEVRIRQTARDNSRQAILVVDRSKFGRHAPAVGGYLHEADHVVTEARPDARFSALLDALDDRLIVVGDAS
ncbi:DeoR/GlpR family DNA-binding transcription regulator [Anianabacter salinae]|uniref:DeoR/GlpR family DNA-binding transcription regulator n=1 Tax=Anianabacter salinae TaxID=2851023 RepID=UPI00225E6854|nr:DeoR/GlpR family DNA-binding transcription regulator [Anianabacter salinae]MBV0913770.1 DeoR/GlpR family DNA-binding transcription regulator [Anianabacter salinae]